MRAAAALRTKERVALKAAKKAGERAAKLSTLISKLENRVRHLSMFRDAALSNQSTYVAKAEEYRALLRDKGF